MSLLVNCLSCCLIHCVPCKNWNGFKKTFWRYSCIYLLFTSWKVVTLTSTLGRAQADPHTSRSSLCLLQLQNTVGIQSRGRSCCIIPIHILPLNPTPVGTFKWGIDGKLFPFWQISFKVWSKQSYKKKNVMQTSDILEFILSEHHSTSIWWESVIE